MLQKAKEIPFSEKAHIHSILASLLSLICVIHLEEVEPLRKYVDQVISFRTENAPHLLPPLYVSFFFNDGHNVQSSRFKEWVTINSYYRLFFFFFLQPKYSVASHHTTDYHDQLYFVEEEILYALQRCWLGRRQTVQRKSIVDR